MTLHAQAMVDTTDGLSARNFARLAEYIYAYSGIKMSSSKKIMLEGRLRRLVRHSRRRDLNDYCQYLFEEGGLDHETVELIDVVTTNKTDFFREIAHFDVLSSKLLPALVTEGRTQLKLWSSACSTGAEAYTLAMVLEEFMRGHKQVDYSILSTDLSTKVLAQAHEGIYPRELVAPVPLALRQRYLMTARDRQRDAVRIIPSIRAKHSVARVNLMDAQYPVDRDMDIIFCRNVLIYFDKETQEQVLRRLCSHLRIGGYLFLGHSESLGAAKLPLRAVANTVFQRC